MTINTNISNIAASWRKAVVAGIAASVLLIGLSGPPAVAEAAVTSGTPSTVAASGSIEMYRLYNPNSGEHFYTASAAERDNLAGIGWRYEGVGWLAPSKSSSPVHRMYNPNSGDHHYTLSSAERDNLVSIGWRYEGVGWYSDGSKGAPLYRQFNPNEVIGTHNYTTSKVENDRLVRIGWRAEGVGWYGHNFEDHYTTKKVTKQVPVYGTQYYIGCWDCDWEIVISGKRNKYGEAIENQDAAKHQRLGHRTESRQRQVQTGTKTVTTTERVYDGKVCTGCGMHK